MAAMMTATTTAKMTKQKAKNEWRAVRFASSEREGGGSNEYMLKTGDGTNSILFHLV